MRPAIELDSLTPQARLAARSHRMIEFPVSSGSSHRVKESSPGRRSFEVVSFDTVPTEHCLNLAVNIKGLT